MHYVGAPQLTLTSQPVTSGTYCPGPVNFTCVGTDIGDSLFWLVNDSIAASYPFKAGDTYPQSLTVTPPLDQVTIQIISVTTNANSNLDIISVFAVGDVSVLFGASITAEAFAWSPC